MGSASEVSLLLINTSSRSAEIAFDGKVYSTQDLELGGAEALSPLLENIEDLSQIKKISFISGPGSYTGLRVGYSFSKGLGLGLKIPVIGISTFIAHTCLIEVFEGTLGVAIAASPVDFYYCEFNSNKTLWMPLSEPSIIGKDELELLVSSGRSNYTCKKVDEFFAIPANSSSMFKKINHSIEAQNIDWKGHLPSESLIYMKPVAAKSLAERNLL